MENQLTAQQDMLAFIEKSLPEGDYKAREVATSILAAAPADLLEAWTQAIVAETLTETISKLRLIRGRQARSQSSSAFSDAADAAESGDTEPLSVFAQHVIISLDNTVRAIGKMTKQDHLFISSRYSQRARNANFEAAFHAAVAAKIPDGKTTSDVFSEETYLKLRESITL